MATLLLMEQLRFFNDFVQGDVKDSHLPLDLGRKGQRPILYDRDDKEIGSRHEWSWKYPEAEFFMVKQMQLCSLFCTVEEDTPKGGFVNHFQLPYDAILPFRDCEAPKTVHGGFGTVTKVQIEPSHFRYQGKSRKPKYFAVKTIRHSMQEHPYEADSLARRVAIPNMINREHLHRLLFSFRRADLYYLVFEWADGDLTELWQRMPDQYKPNDHEHVCWFFRQCVGIVRSLHSLQNHHRSYSASIEGELRRVRFNGSHGRHSDIKPQNILWFENYQGTKKDHLVIADLGLAQFNSTQSKSQVLWANVRGCTQTYKAPESDVETFVTGKYDIWGLGCVFLEHASVFLLGDAKCIDEFSNSRKGENEGHKKDRCHLVN
ncbi:hypothetical protein Neosp_013884 [[Neocosmospora] mangrovei]